ncbi:MAG: 2-C-methyl-D-erythritol 4-phosphate cytidylyltransferase, partial [Calditrichales bacterium]
AILSKLSGFKEKFSIVIGGKERQDSVYNGLQALPSQSEIVVVHDGVRPFVSPHLLLQSIQTASEFGACVAAVPVKDTIKRVAEGRVIETVPREELWQIQTPQTFRFSILKDAHEKARKSTYYSTDESSLVEWAGYPVRIVQGDYFNIKLTTMEDLLFSRMLLAEGHVK